MTPMRFFGRSCSTLLLAVSLMLGGAMSARAQAQVQAQAQSEPAAATAAPSAQPQSPAQAQVERQQSQPLNNAPVWREVRKDGQEHYTSVQGRETGVLIQSGGESWRQLRNGPITFYGGLAVTAGQTAAEFAAALRAGTLRARTIEGGAP